MTHLPGLRKLSIRLAKPGFRLSALTPRRLLTQKIVKVGQKFKFGKLNLLSLYLES